MRKYKHLKRESGETVLLFPHIKLSLESLLLKIVEDSGYTKSGIVKGFSKWGLYIDDEVVMEIFSYIKKHRKYFDQKINILYLRLAIEGTSLFCPSMGIGRGLGGYAAISSCCPGIYA